MAFDRTFDEARFLDGHVFGSARNEVGGGLWDGMTPVLRSVTARLGDLWGELPAAWTEDAGFGYDDVVTALQRLEAAARLFGGAPP